MTFKATLASVLGVVTLTGIILGAIFMPAVAIAFAVIGSLSLGAIALSHFWKKPKKARTARFTEVVNVTPDSVIIPVAKPAQKNVKVVRVVKPAVVVSKPVVVVTPAPVISKPVKVVHTVEPPAYVCDPHLPLATQAAIGVSRVVKKECQKPPIAVQVGDRVIKVVDKARTAPPIGVQVGSRVMKVVRETRDAPPMHVQIGTSVSRTLHRPSSL